LLWGEPGRFLSFGDGAFFASWGFASKLAGFSAGSAVVPIREHDLIKAG
jgi:hypothetical protein